MGTAFGRLGLAADADNAARIQGTLRRSSRWLAAILGVLMWSAWLLVAAMILALVLYRGSAIGLGPEGGYIGTPVPDGYTPFAALATRFRVGGIIAVVLQFTPGAMLLKQLRDLFRLYARGVVFSRRNALLLKHTAAWLVAYAACPLLSHVVLSATGLIVDQAWFHADEVKALVVGLLLFGIAQVMEFGHEIERDREGIV
ncbi:MAG: hypothetical protein ACRYG6_01585 [Janthinobacterium lividum]